MIINKKVLFGGLLSIFAFIVLICGVTYAFFNYTRTGNSNTVSTGNIKFDYTLATQIDVQNDFPQYEDMTSAEEIALKSTHNGSLSITGHNTLENGVGYRIYVLRGDDISGKQRLADESIKFQLEPDFTNGSNGFKVISNNYAEPTNLSFDANGKALISTGLVRNTSQLTTVNYNFYMWIDASTTHISSTMKRATLAEGNPSLADTSSGNVTASRYMKNDGTLTTVTLFPASSNESGKIVYTTNEFSNGYYNIKILVEAEEYVPPIICRRVTSVSNLHTETCSQGSDGCYADGYYAGGSKDTTIITYGTAKEIGVSSGLEAGDAFDCNVDGTGYNQRFYYISNYYDTSTQEFDTSTAVLVYYSNTYNDGSTIVASNVGAPYATQEDLEEAGFNVTSYDNWHGPVTAVKNLPTIQEWTNVELKKDMRALLAESTSTHNATSTQGGELPTGFSYAGRAARLLTFKEAITGCGLDHAGSGDIGEFSTCNFLFEGTKYAVASRPTHAIWLETPYYPNATYVWYLAAPQRYATVYNANVTNIGVRPVIDVPYSQLEY